MMAGGNPHYNASGCADPTTIHRITRQKRQRGERMEYTSQQKKRWLQRYRVLGREVDRLNRQINKSLQDIDAIRATAERTTTVLSDMPGSGGFKSREDIYAKLVDMSEEVDLLVDGYVDQRRIAEKQRDDIITAIRKLDDPAMETLMILRYVDDLTFEEIAVGMTYCIRQIWRIHGGALNRLQVEE